MDRSQLLHHGRISKVRFSLAGSESVKNDSHVNVKSYDLFRDNLPYPGGVCDAHMGTTDHAYRCQTCYNNKRNCLGHPGHIHLNYPVWSGMAVLEAHKWLKLICFNCGHPIVSEEIYSRFAPKKRLVEASKIARTKNKKCIHCDEIHPLLKKDPTEPLALSAEFYVDKVQTEKYTLLPHKAGEILSRISDETVIKMGKDPASHPRHAILTDIQVPPVTIRPDVKKIGGGRSTNDELTNMLQVLIKKNDSMPPVIPEDIDPKLEKAIFDLSNSYYDFVKAGGENSINSLATRLKGKEGRFRMNQMGKRTRNMCRGTIAGDPRLRADEVGVPMLFARTIQYEETVQEFNKKRLLGYVQNGRKKYPGATKIKKKISGTEYDVGSGRDFDLDTGDIVFRDMLDGDPVNFNRQPSLAISNVSTHWAKVIRDETIMTIMINVLCTPLYNADFDGDAMHLIICAGVAARNEIAELSTVSNWMISHSTSAPSIGQVEDSIVGCAEITRSKVRFNKYHAMLLCQSTSILPSFSDVGKDGISGRDCMSKLLADTPINFTRRATWYKQDMTPYIKYDPSEIHVKIDQGKILTGILDKSSTGKKQTGGIYHIITNEYGATKALEVMFNMQQMAINYMFQFGGTIGISDLMLPREAKSEIDRLSSDIINKSRLITERLHKGEIIPPIGKTVSQYYEELQINTLRVFDDFTDPILTSIDPESNNFFKMIMFGSKGSLGNVFNIMSAIGQKLINGERAREQFGFKRTLAYFPRFDTSPGARGYITNSYLSGMTSSEYVFDAMSARFDLISKSLSTSITGEQNRKSVKNLESIIINNLRFAVKNHNVIQFVYGEDFLDPRKVEKVTFDTTMISDKAFATKYTHTDFPDFLADMTKDRDKYREIFIRVENINTAELMSNTRPMPVNIGRMIRDILREHHKSLKPPTKAVLKDLVAEVRKFVDNLPYILINEIQEARGSKIPEYIQATAWLMQMLARSHLHPNALVASEITPPVLKIIIGSIRLRYSQALISPGTAAGIIAAQSFSDPLTQYMLDSHHRSASGGSSMNFVTKVKEVLGARAVEKLASPSMLLPVLPEYAGDKNKVQEIANTIEVMKLKRFVTVCQIFFEKYGAPEHPDYADEKKMIDDFAKRNKLLTPPGDLTRWCIRMVLNRTTMILKNMSVELIVQQLRDVFPSIYIVHSPENSRKIVLRIYLRNNMFKGQITTQDVRSKIDPLLDTTIRGMNGISGARVVKMIRNKISDDGSIVRNDNVWGISTTGTNIKDILTNDFVDKYRVQSDAIQEMYAMFGIEAARQKIISEIRSIVDICNHRHYLVYADEMSYTGMVTSIESSGLKTRETENVLLRIGFSSPLGTMEEAATNAMEDEVTGITAPLLVGSIPRHGTLYNSFHINREFVQANVKKPDDVLAALFD